MEANKSIRPHMRKKKSQAGFLLDILLETFPNMPLDEAWKYAFELSQSPHAKKYEKLLVELDDQEATSKESFKNLQNMYKAGFSLKHMMLYLEAPLTSPFGEQTTKDEYLKLWACENNFTPQKPQGEDMGRAGVAAKGLATILGVGVMAVGAGAGLAFQNYALFETATIIGPWDFGVVDQVTNVAQSPSIKTILSMMATTFGSVMFWNDLKKTIEQSKDIDLRGKIRDGNNENKEQLFNILEQTPVPIKHLISHFSPEETCLFLLSDDKTQEKMWEVFPPSFEQRQLSLLSERKDKHILNKAWGHLKLSGSTWKPQDENGFVQGAITLKESLLKLRKHKQSLEDTLEDTVNPSLPKPI